LPLGRLDGVQLTWGFYSFSPAYETALGIVEVVLGLLLLFRRTTMLGVLLFLPVMANLVLINFVFDIGAFATALPLFLAGLYLFFADFKKLKEKFWDEPGESARRTRLLPKLICCFVGCALAAMIVYNNKFRYQQDPKLRGGWTPLRRQSGVDKLYFEKGKQCVIRDESLALHFTDYVVDAQRLTVVKNDAGFGITNARYEVYGDTLRLKSEGAVHTFLRR
jgi:hypothetical protein